MLGLPRFISEFNHELFNVTLQEFSFVSQRRICRLQLHNLCYQSPLVDVYLARCIITLHNNSNKAFS